MNRGQVALTLPRLAESVPRKIVPGRLGAANASISRFLLDAKAFRDTDLPESFDDSMRACEQALAKWVAREIGPLRCLRPSFHMQVLSGLGNWVAPSHEANARDPAAYGGVEISWCEASAQEWPVGQRLEELEATLPGLGATVLHVLHRQSLHAYPLFTPEVARDFASWVYWYGEEDEETALDMHCGEDDAEREAARAEMVTRDLLDDAFPMWARTWPGRRSREQGPAGWKTIDLRKALPLLSDPRQRSIVTDASALARLRIEDGFRCDCDGEFVGFGAVLSWSESDLTTRVFDDLMQQANEGECHDRMGEFQIVLNTPSALKKWQQAMRPRFKAIGLIDRLIGALSS
ncbi:MAG: PRTRC system protein F [Burkholderiaceae bacterium]|nr:PRTRC system protein F [Burkholderiaceae bacterium]